MTAIVAFLSTSIGRYLLIGVGGFVALWIYGIKKEHDGYDRCKVEWSDAESKARQIGRDAASDAANDVRGGVLQDRFDRDDN